MATVSQVAVGKRVVAPAPPQVDYLKLAIVVAIGIVLFLLPPPSGLPDRAWHYFAMFVSVVLGLILEPIPSAAVGLVAISFSGALGLVFTAEQFANPDFAITKEAIAWVLSGFANSTVWLIFAAFMFALGYEKTGLGKRLSLVLVRALGKRTLGLGYAVALADLILAPFTPSNTARSGGTIFPIINNIPGLYGSEPGDTSRKIGSYLMWIALATTCVTSSLFLTALAPNLLAVDLVKQVAGIEISWMQWFIGFLPAGLILLVVLPWLVYKIYPPEIKTSKEVPEWADKELAQMGRISIREIIMLVLVFFALGMWIFGGDLLDATLVAILVIALMVVTGIVGWSDILANKAAWNVLIWFATLVTLAGGLSKVGFIGWFADKASALLTGISPMIVMLALVALFFAVHYMFASVTAHTTAILPVFLAAGAAIPGIPVTTFALLLCFSLGIMGIITPYATGPSPVYYGSGYVSRKDFWVLGLVFGVIYLVALLVITTPWLAIVQ
jgi:L-tartrate/succinate antiporter